MNGKFWTQEEIKYLTLHYANERTDEIAKVLKCKSQRVYNKANLLGLRKSEEFLKSDLSGRITKMKASGLNYRFKKGQVPSNKGKKQTEYMSAEAIKKTLKTRFKPGQKIHNEKAVGAIVIRTHRGVKCPFIKIANSVWMPLKNKVWMDANGDIPKMYVVRVKDGNVFNCQLENLELITMKENMAKNSIVNIPEELLPLVKLNNKLKKTINEKLK